MEHPVFRHCFQVRLHDTDAAGVLFFGHLFRHAHDAYESFMAELGFPLHGLIQREPPDASTRLPITHAEADFKRPLRQGDTVEVELRVREVRPRSFSLDYRFLDPDGNLCASARTVHVYLSDTAGSGLQLPDGLGSALATRASPPDGAPQTPTARGPLTGR